MIFTLVFVASLTFLNGARSGCPISCNCTDYSVNCISQSLENVPYFESLTNVPVIIDLSGNFIPYIDMDDFSFDKSDQVKEIYLNNSNVNSIEERALEELENLQELYLAGNLLNSLPEDFISKNTDLMLLDLSNNLFVDIPKIKSWSLEVLALADCGISNIPNDALEGLPNLRILLLQQNNLKYVSPAMFENMNLFYVRLAYNPWSCDCKTVNLFSYLTVKGFTDITEPIQCLDDNKNFIDIFDSKGVMVAFQGQCAAFSDSENMFQAQELFQDLEDDEEDLAGFYPLKIDDDDDDYEIDLVVKTTSDSADEFIENNLIYWYLLLFIAVPLSLILGVVFGSCVTYRHMVVQMNRFKNESMKELLTHKEEYI